MDSLAKPLRRKLEKTVIEARDVAEAAARSVLEHLGIGESDAPRHLTEEQRALRRRLRAHGRQLGDHRRPDGHQSIEHLVQETAYEHWHRMLFARFLAENNLLMHPDGVPLTLNECDELAPDEGAANGWELAGRYASHMLPQIFRPDSPVLALTLAPEHQRALERLLAGLASETFQAQDSLGWVYQFWQVRKKEEVNRSEVKIGADELPAVTQLFTEPYMVNFLLDNSLGAWWVANHPDKPRPVPMEYLRMIEVEVASSRFKRLEGASTKNTDDEPYGYFKKSEPLGFSSGNLPHWRQDGVTYFVTFRTADSLPQEKLKQWWDEQQAWLEQHPELHDDEVEAPSRRLKRLEAASTDDWLFNARIEHWLDHGYGECRLAIADNKNIVERALQFFDSNRYRLGEYIVMPNHVHVLVTPLGKHQLSDIIHSWKSYTANAINKHDGRKGAFWQKEYFDHIVRTPDQMERIILYIKQNPVQKPYADIQRLYNETFTVEAASNRIEHVKVEAASNRIEHIKVEAASNRIEHIKVEAASSRLKRLEGASTLPAAGCFDAWPKHLGELKVMDPCCGSGHFLVAAFLMLVPMRMALEGLLAGEAVDRVLVENIHGLELDQRCVELAAFALALTAWRYPDAGGYRGLPELHLACSGLSVGIAKEEWKQLALDRHNLRIALDWMHDTFRDAPVLGSLLNPAKSQATKIVQWEELSETLDKALSQEQTDEQYEAGVVAQGLAKAAVMLAGRYQWVITNVPYLSRGKQSDTLREYCGYHYPAAKNDLATVFLDRCLEFCVEDGTTSIVLPQNWLFLTSYKKFREKLLTNDTWHLIARLGPGAFETISGEVVKAILITLSRGAAANEGGGLFANESAEHWIHGLDVSEPRTPAEKAAGLLVGEIKSVGQGRQLGNPDARIVIGDLADGKLLSEMADYGKGSTTGDRPRFVVSFWELSKLSARNEKWLNSPVKEDYWGGREKVTTDLVSGKSIKKQLGARIHGQNVWGRKGVAVNKMRGLQPFFYMGEVFDDNVGNMVPSNEEHVMAIWAYVVNGDYARAVRKIDQKLNVTAATLTKVPFDLAHWTKIAQKKYPNGLPKPYSEDPTQWIFHGHPAQSDDALQVAVARLLGYRWPAEVEAASSRFKRLEGASTMELSDKAHTWIARCKDLAPYVDDDGIACIPTIRGEKPAAERLLDLLQAAYGDDWSAYKLNQLLEEAKAKGKGLDWWIRERFFEQHSKQFQHRPFIWHIWDGLKDGFAALVNYHKLDHKTLETLIYTYLGDWIGLQERAVSDGLDGAELRLTAAQDLKKRLEWILEGETPYDIFVRWKPLKQQPIGWNPDLNDGVRLNIRPFMTAEVLRYNRKPKLNIHWNKDRGKDVESAPWYRLGLEYDGKEGDRINNHHLSLAEKRVARESLGEQPC